MTRVEKIEEISHFFPSCTVIEKDWNYGKASTNTKDDVWVVKVCIEKDWNVS